VLRLARDQLAHVGNIEDADVMRTRGVFFPKCCSCIAPASATAEGNDFGAEPEMFVVERGAFFRRQTHCRPA
jgi:hypothetical protein